MLVAHWSGSVPLTAAALMAASGLGAQSPSTWRPGPPLPRPVTNNAVAALETSEGPAVFSFLGIDTSKSWRGVVSWAFRWDLRQEGWREVTPVPGSGRLASTAQAVDGRIYLFGGYTVAGDGSEVSVPSVDVYDPETDTWASGAPIPVPVDDAVSGVWRDSLIYLVSGWHDRDNVPLVQVYDPFRDAWQEGTSIPGPPVFGHGGAVAGDQIVYVDGTNTLGTSSPRFRIESSSWRGRVVADAPTEVRWTRLPDHPGPPLYRPGAGAAGFWALFAGGTDNPYNYDGMGYDGTPSRPLAGVMGYNTETHEWVELPPLPVPSMDHRQLGIVGGWVILVGGMDHRRRVTDRVWRAPLGELLPQGGF